jgi:hypothetical protein
MPQRAAYSGILDLSRLTFRSPERASPGILVRGASSCGIGPVRCGVICCEQFQSKPSGEGDKLLGSPPAHCNAAAGLARAAESIDNG